MSDAVKRHAEQVEFWNGPVAVRWAANQERIERLMADFSHAAQARAAAQPGEKVIDIGCGSGSTTERLAQNVGESGEVLGIDISEPILAIAKQRLAKYPQAAAILSDASTYRFEAGVADLVFSRFGVMFFGDPTAAFRNIRLALKPNGRLVFVCWRVARENPWNAAPQDSIFQFVPRPPPPGRDDPGQYSFSDPGRVTDILTGAGFARPTIEPIDTLVDIADGGGVDGALRILMESGPIPRALAEASDVTRTNAEDALYRYLTSIVDDSRVRLAAAGWIVSASRQ